MKVSISTVVLTLSFVAPFCPDGAQESQTNNGTVAPASGTVTQYDSMTVINMLKLNSEDSTFIHQPDTTLDSYGDEITEELRRKIISPNLSEFDFRFILSTYHRWVDYAPNDRIRKDFASCLVLYKSTDGKSPIKTIRQDSIEIIPDNESTIVPKIQFVDINFDGYKDFVISFTENTSGNNCDNLFWIYNPAKSQFDADTTLNNLFNDLPIYIDGSNEISSGGHNANSSSTEFFRWNGTTYKLYAEESSRELDDDIGTVKIRKELVKGEWVTVSADTVK